MASILDGSTMRCSFGLSPARLALVPPGRPANINDGKLHNIRSFGTCQSPANPAVAALMMATRGAANRAPCQPICRGAWTPARPVSGSQQMVGNPPAPAIDEHSFLICAYGGVISFPQSQTPSASAQGALNIGSAANANSAFESTTRSQSNPPPNSRGSA